MQRPRSLHYGTLVRKFQATFAHCTKGCLGVAVLRGRPLTHVRSLSMKNLIPFIALFLCFFFTKNSQRGCIRVRKFDGLKADTHTTRSTMGVSIARKRTRLGRRVLLHQLAQGCAKSCIMTCFSCAAAMVFRYSKRARTFFYLKCASGKHVTWNSAVPDPNVWCCIP